MTFKDSEVEVIKKGKKSVKVQIKLPLGKTIEAEVEEINDNIQ
jgi:hypothetical protein